MSLCYIGCANYNNHADNYDFQNSFLQYLRETFNDKDYIEEQMFIIIPCNGCSGCEQMTYSIFIEKLLNSEDFTLIICNPADKGLLLPALNAVNVRYDFRSKMADYYFGYGYPTCIIVKNNIVVENYSLSPDVIQWINKYNSFKR
jgi:hypothetical protein